LRDSATDDDKPPQSETASGAEGRKFESCRAYIEAIPNTRMNRDDIQPAVAGFVTSFVGFFGSFSVVLAGLTAIGATHAESSSGLAVLSITMGVLAIVLAWRTRMPLSIAWSTPGAAVLIGAGHVHGGYAAALGAFVVSGALFTLAGLSARFERLVTSIPGPIASALLAGVLLPVCISPARSLIAYPGLTAPVVAVWLLLTRISRRAAVPGAFAVAAISLVISRRMHTRQLSHPFLHLTAVAPTFHLGAILSIALPLFLVTMASQNLAGMAVLALHGYRPRLRPILTSTGLMSAISAPFGGHAINLAAITAGLMAGPDAGPRTDRRWVAAAVGGTMYILLGLFTGLATGLVADAPAVLIEAVAGLALLGALGEALRAATASAPLRDAALATLVVTASGISAISLGAPFWGLTGGLTVLFVQRAGLGRDPHLTSRRSPAIEPDVEALEPSEPAPAVDPDTRVQSDV
jgi:benzoate membrane transport protein